MEMFVRHNAWNGRLPCPKCLGTEATTVNTKPPKKLRGHMRIVGQRISTGKYIYACFTCRHEEEK